VSPAEQGAAAKQLAEQTRQHMEAAKAAAAAAEAARLAAARPK
jgi:hypothetical protein